jgi:hypothetical protein
VTSFLDVINYVSENFQLNVESEYASNLLMIRVPGVDNVSIARYIREKYPDLIVTTREVEGYKISNTGWIKVERCGS